MPMSYLAPSRSSGHGWQRPLLQGACLFLLIHRSSSQVCRSSFMGSAVDVDACSKGAGGARISVEAPFALSFQWAASLIPEGCDTQDPQSCSWSAVGDVWRYALNNLHVALQAASEEDKEWLPIEQTSQLRQFVGALGHDPGAWLGNWPNYAAFARQAVDLLRQWCDEHPHSVVPVSWTNIGTRFPTLGRSVVVPTDGDTGATVTLANGFALPVLGFGVWQIPADGTTYRSVRWALELGYRHIDTAQDYGNEHEVGRAIRESKIPREQICLVTKLSAAEEFRFARQRFEQQLAVLGVEYVDVYMLHSPGHSKEDRQSAWQQLEELYDEGKIKALGVSNFGVDLLQELLDFARVRPVYIQNKYSIYHPGGRQEALKDHSLMEWLAREQIVLTGYSVIHPEHIGYLSPMDDPHVKAIAARHQRTASQILHRWLLQLGAAVIPRSTKYERIRENSDLFSFALSEADMRLLNGIASLVNSDPGSRSPVWLDDVYGLQQ
eukprot:TRINITY_DN8323_c0_g3_i1.p1 TRINITY_DN8323_c0_g3~~TRINITY_DN8323_c0_g3_i1.p1  ORF type:complete len:494 (+),score=59.52 TRINITY_DN8323_c0_g3_i1:32-1513(+)